jgi:hypothetical protein
MLYIVGFEGKCTYIYDASLLGLLGNQNPFCK